MSSDQLLAASFRDPGGFLFSRDGTLYRQINLVGKDDYDHFMDSGLYQALMDAGVLIPHQEVDVDPPLPHLAYKVIQPEKVPFISYPYEWCFGQLQDAALATLKLQKTALQFGMSLKDASAYNIQFVRGQPMLIDTLSFEVYREGKPWDAYRQFCQHFLAPLALMAHRDVRLSQLLRVYIDGVPLDLASQLLPLRTRFIFPLLIHIHLHASAQGRYSDAPGGEQKARAMQTRQVSKTSLLGMVDNLETSVAKLRWGRTKTEWADYYTSTNYTSSASEHKKRLVEMFVERVQPKMMWDLGANTGLFSRVASDKGIFTVAFDIDPGAVQQNYADCSTQREANILPLVLDLTNPSPALGWAHQERMSFQGRGEVDLILALALIHHLAIGNNVPLFRIAEFLNRLTRWLVIEFVAKDDSQVQHLLATRADIFPDYTREGFEQAFGAYFEIHVREDISDSERTMYLMKRKGL
jgi:hypothetical protein